VDDFRGKVVLITGGSSGIGLALAQAFAAAGAAVTVCGRDPGRLAAARGGGVEAIACDITEPDQVTALLARLQARHGRLDILVNNAGWMEERDFRAAPLDGAALAAEVAANLTAHVQVTNLALPLIARGGAIVFVGSGYGWAPWARAPVYSACKAGVRAFAQTLRLQLANRNVAVMEVVPPAVDTPATTHRRVAKIAPERVAAATLAGLRRGRREVFVGEAAFLPWLLRLSPRLAERIVGRG